MHIPALNHGPYKHLAVNTHSLLCNVQKHIRDLIGYDTGGVEPKVLPARLSIVSMFPINHEFLLFDNEKPITSSTS